MKIFLSHSSNDTYIVNAFTNHILKIGLNIKECNIFCTSIQGAGIKSGENFLHRIETELNNTDIVFLFISSNYKSSEICLNEMGAAWALKKKVIPLLLPSVSFHDLGYLHSFNQAICLNKKNSLISLCQDIIDDFNFDINNWPQLLNQIDQFINNQIQNIKTQKHEYELKNRNIDFTFFNKFLKEDIDQHKLFLSSQPTLSDCRRIFSEQFYKKYYAVYNLLYLQQQQFPLLDKEREIDCFEYFNSRDHFPGGINEMINFGAFNNPKDLYVIRFKKNDDEYGISYKIWSYINDRWVFFISPHRVFDLIINMDNSEDITSLKRSISKAVNKNTSSFEFNLASLSITEELMNKEVFKKFQEN